MCHVNRNLTGERPALAVLLEPPAPSFMSEPEQVQGAKTQRVSKEGVRIGLTASH